jgi:starch synthase
MVDPCWLKRPESAAPGNTSDLGSRMIEEDVMMSGPSAQPRILFVTPEVVFMPKETGNSTDYNYTYIGGVGDLLAGLISDLFNLGIDVYVTQPDYRRIFADLSRKSRFKVMKKIPGDRVHLTRDRIFFYSNYPHSNSQWENTKISVTFQREVMNHVIPEIQPDLLHCHDWMTGLIPAMAKKNGVPCLFTVQNPDTAKGFLSYIEDQGIDAASFWQHLFYDRYPFNYEETRESNPVNFLLSGIFAANFVNTSSSAFLAKIGENQNLFAKSPIWGALVKKSNACRVAVNSNLAKTQQYINIYERILQRSLLHTEREKFEFFDAVAPSHDFKFLNWTARKTKRVRA